MVSAKEAKRLIDGWIVRELERLEKEIKLADCGLKAKQKDVQKVKDEIRKRINKIEGIVLEVNSVQV